MWIPFVWVQTAVLTHLLAFCHVVTAASLLTRYERYHNFLSRTLFSVFVLYVPKTKSFTYEPYTKWQLSSSSWRRLCLLKYFIYFRFCIKHFVFFIIRSSNFTHLGHINNHSVTDGKVHIEQDKSQGTTELVRIVLLTMVRNAGLLRDADGTSWPHQSWQECWPSHKRAQPRISDQYAPCV